jgi:hypothetical protein
MLPNPSRRPLSSMTPITCQPDGTAGIGATSPSAAVSAITERTAVNGTRWREDPKACGADHSRRHLRPSAAGEDNADRAAGLADLAGRRERTGRRVDAEGHDRVRVLLAA